MNIDAVYKNDQKDKPLTRTDVENLLLQVGSSDKLNLSGRNLTGINLSFLSLAKINLSRANLSGATLSETNLFGATLFEANLSKATLFKANLSGANLSKANLSEAILFEANLSEAILSKATFFRANLSRAILFEADLFEADLFEADLSEAILFGANLFRANLDRAILFEANLFEANLFGANLSRAKGFNKTKKEAEADTTSFSIRIMEEPLTPQNLTFILSAITELSTKCWLIGKGRFEDLIEYTQTHDVRFVEETQIAFTKIAYNSPFDGSIKIDVSATNVVDAIVTAADGAIQWKKRLEKAELENKEKAQVIELAKQKANDESKAAGLEREKQELALERERLEIFEKRLETINKALDYAHEIAMKTVNVMHPNADDQTKAMLIQTLVPTILQMQNSNGIELFLPAPQPQNNEEKK